MSEHDTNLTKSGDTHMELKYEIEMVKKIFSQFEKSQELRDKQHQQFCDNVLGICEKLDTKITTETKVILDKANMEQGASNNRLTILETKISLVTTIALWVIIPLIIAYNGIIQWSDRGNYNQVNNLVVQTKTELSDRMDKIENELNTIIQEDKPKK